MHLGGEMYQIPYHVNYFKKHLFYQIQFNGNTIFKYIQIIGGKISSQMDSSRVFVQIPVKSKQFDLLSLSFNAIGWLTPSNVLLIFNITEHKVVACLVFSC